MITEPSEGAEMKTKLKQRIASGWLNVLSLTLVIFSLAFSGSHATAQEDNSTAVQQAVLVELFTSEGCSSCPPADDNLKRLAKLADDKGFPIYTLSYHVDYWDYLGWKDRFSSAAATKRQRRYSAAFRLNRIYTPQFVVNGRWEFVGSNRTHTRAAILKAMDERVSAETSVTAKTMGAKIEVQFLASGLAEGNRLVIALAQKSAESDVTRGENSGRTLDHIHVVRDFREVSATSSVKVSFSKPRDFNEGDYHVLAYVQAAKDLSLIGIAQAEITANAVADTVSSDTVSSDS